MNKNRGSKFSKSKISGTILDLSVRKVNLPKICPVKEVEGIQEALLKIPQFNHHSPLRISFHLLLS
jgi:hypothetical protein